MGNIIFLFKAFAGSFKWFNIFVFQAEQPEEPTRELSTWTLFSQFSSGCCIDSLLLFLLFFLLLLVVGRFFTMEKGTNVCVFS